MHTEISSEIYGKWESPLSAEMIAQKTLSFGDLHVDGNSIYWSENRPSEQNRNVIVSYDKNGSYKDETDQTYNVTTGVHGYGGGAFLAKDNFLYFSDSITGLIYQKDIARNIISPITSNRQFQYADFSVDKDHKFLYCIQKNELKTCIVRIFIETKEVEELFSGADFYSNVRMDPSGKKIAWLQWNHPNMPWDSTELWCAQIDSDFKITHIKKISHAENESFYQPEWSPDGVLFVASDRGNYWNIFKYENDTFYEVFKYDADFGRPMWILGTRCYAFLSQTQLIACCIEKGIWKTVFIDLKKNNTEFLENNLTCIYNMAGKNDTIAFIAGNEKTPLSIVSMSSRAGHLSSRGLTAGSINLIRSSCNNSIPDAFYPIPQRIEFPTSDQQTAHAFYYPPQNPNFCAPNNSLPPLIIKIHGGPTANVDFIFNPKIQYYTSRGFAYVEINYRGSTGYGRKYREQIKGKWGMIDVDDCFDCADYLCNMGKADRNKLIISGSSSGGYTLLCSLAFRKPFYKAASCLYGIGDLIALSEQTHKFEAFYDQSLIGADISTQQGREIYQKRSPLNSADKIQTPTIFFHGNKDFVVSVEQTLKMANALKKNNIQHEVYVFEGEGHGIKKSENIVTFLNKELEFFKEVVL